MRGRATRTMRAHLGFRATKSMFQSYRTSTSGGNSVFHIRILETFSSDRVLIANCPTKRSAIPRVEGEVESTFVHPLLKGADVAAWRVVPSGHILLPHQKG